MNVLAQTKREWVAVIALPLKVGILFGGAALFVYHQVLLIPGVMSAIVNHDMKVVAVPVATGCIAAIVLLIGIGVIELFQHRRKQAIWDFVFAVLALYFWTEAQGLTRPVM